MLKPLLLTTLLLLTGCSAPELERLPEDATLLAFGDSLTVGVGASPGNDYPRVLANLTNLAVISAGVSGETTAQGLTRIQAVLDKTDPDLLILLEGGNDILRNVRQEQIKSNLAQMITLAQARGIEVLLIGVPEKGLFSRVAPFYEELAEEHEVLLIDSLIGELLHEPKYKSDPIHLNDAGYRVLAETIVTTLEDSGAL